MNCKHYYYFGEQIDMSLGGKVRPALNQDRWDALRTDGRADDFRIEETSSEYESNNRKSENRLYAEMAKIMCEEIFDDTDRIISVGAGKAILEWHIKQNKPSIKVACADYTSKAIKRLQQVFICGDEFFEFDMLKDDWRRLQGYDYIIMFRISTEFDRRTWKRLFRKLYNAGIHDVIFVPTGLDNIKTMTQEIINHIVNILHRRKDCFCGWLYSENEFRKMWSPYYDISFAKEYGSTKLYWLSKQTRRHKL